ncbi:efflux RND transporter periplasmic adaptor subunit [Candidatus Microgenomates bacterium]|nr:MAG: efflux RND transporter periplasmic adaptor subunit [Candidatus Microgenomates bacterium]
MLNRIKFKITKKRIIAIILLLIVGVFVLYSSQKNGNGFDQSVVSRGEVVEELVLTGELKASEYANLQFNSSGTVSWVGVKMGEEVQRGSALVKLDTTALNSSYQRALADLRYAEATVNRVHDDLKDKGSTETFLEKETRVAAEVAHDKAYEAYLAAQKNLKDATLTAPFAGFVTYLANEASGVNVTAAVPQVTIINPSTIYFEVNADQTEVSRFKVGDRAKIVFDAFDNKEIDAEVTFISITPDPTDSGTVYPIRLKLSVDNTNYLYKIAMTGDVSFVLSKKEDVLYVDPKYINSDKNGKYVLVNEGYDKKYIEVGIEGDDRVEIQGDISEGEFVFD